MTMLAGAALAIANARADLERDVAAGTVSVATRLGLEGSWRLHAALWLLVAHRGAGLPGVPWSGTRPDRPGGRRGWPHRGGRGAGRAIAGPAASGARLAVRGGRGRAGPAGVAGGRRSLTRPGDPSGAMRSRTGPSVVPNAAPSPFVIVGARGRDPGPDGPPREWRPTSCIESLATSAACWSPSPRSPDGGRGARSPSGFGRSPAGGCRGRTDTRIRGGRQDVPVRPEAPAVPEADEDEDVDESVPEADEEEVAADEAAGERPQNHGWFVSEAAKAATPDERSTTTAPTCPRSPAVTRASPRRQRPRARRGAAKAEAAKARKADRAPKGAKGAQRLDDPRPPSDEAGAIGAGFVMSRSVRSVSRGCRPSGRWRSRSPGGASRSSGTSPGWPGRSR